MRSIPNRGAARFALLCLAAGLAVLPARALEDGQALTPPMGWNSWNRFKGNLTEDKFKAIADAFVASGLREAGYKYLVVDDGWLEAQRDPSGSLVTVAAQYPHGMKALGDYAHARGLGFGIYACPTKTTCMRRMGSYGYEAKDAALFASFGVDYLKYDWCGVQSGEDANGGLPVEEVKRRFAVMRDALKATGRDIVYSLSEKNQGTHGVAGTWSDTVGHLWRIGGDIGSTWSSVVAHANQDAELARYAGPGGWNDPDMLEVGNGSLTVAENRAHFALWCILAAPLILGNDPSAMSDSVKAILTDRAAIAIDQDPLGWQGQRIRGKGALEVWVKPLAGGQAAALLFNATDAPARIEVSWNDSLINWGANASADVREAFTGKITKNVRGGYAAEVAAHDAVLLRIAKPGALSLTGPRPALRAARGGWTAWGDRAGTAEVRDPAGRLEARFPIAPGWNGLPRGLAPGLHWLRLPGAPAAAWVLAP